MKTWWFVVNFVMPNGSRSCCSFKKMSSLTPSEHIRSHFPGVVINGVPQPARIRFPGYIGPHFIELGTEPTTHLSLIRAPDFHLDLLGIQDRQHALMHRL